MIAKEVMTQNVISVLPKSSIFDALNALIQHNISGAPVLDSKENLIGVITEKDLLVSLDFVGSKNAKNVKVEEFMTKETVTFREDAPVEEIARVLVQKNIKRVPILRDGKVVGIVSRRDILRCIQQDCNGTR